MGVNCKFHKLAVKFFAIDQVGHHLHENVYKWIKKNNIK